MTVLSAMAFSFFLAIAFSFLSVLTALSAVAFKFLSAAAFNIKCFCLY